jgi:hypothetical protein
VNYPLFNVFSKSSKKPLKKLLETRYLFEGVILERRVNLQPTDEILMKLPNQRDSNNCNNWKGFLK